MIIKIELDGGLDKFISGANSAAAAVDSMEERIVRQAGIAGLENVCGKYSQPIWKTCTKLYSRRK